MKETSEIALLRREETPLAKPWTLMNTHGIVLFLIASSPDLTQRQISDALGLTERRIIQVVRDLVDADMLWIIKVGRRNSYVVNPDAAFRHPTLSHIKLGQFLRILHED